MRSAAPTHPLTPPSLLLWTRSRPRRSIDHYYAVVEHLHRPPPCLRPIAGRRRSKRAFLTVYHENTSIDLVHDHIRSDALPTVLGCTQHLISDAVYSALVTTQGPATNSQFFGDVWLGFRTTLACAGGGFSLSRLAVHKVFHHNKLTLVG